MNKQDEDKIRELVRIHQGTMTDSQYLQMQYALEEMDVWKEEQMIEKSRIWFESVLPEILLNHEPTGVSGIFENFKKAMEE